MTDEMNETEKKKFETLAEVSAKILAERSEESRAALVAKVQTTIYGLRQVFEEQELPDDVLAKVAQVVLINLTGIAHQEAHQLSYALDSSIDSYMLSVSVLVGAFEIPEASEELVEAINIAASQAYQKETLTDDDLKGTGLYL